MHNLYFEMGCLELEHCVWKQHCIVIQPQLDVLDRGNGTCCGIQGEDPCGYRMPSILMRHSSHRTIQELGEPQHSEDIRDKVGGKKIHQGEKGESKQLVTRQ